MSQQGAIAALAHVANDFLNQRHDGVEPCGPACFQGRNRLRRLSGTPAFCPD
jgi:hypothetical protein